MKSVERLNALTEAAEYLRGKHYLDAAAELTVLVNVELDALGYCRRFDEEKPPAAGTAAIG